MLQNLPQNKIKMKRVKRTKGGSIWQSRHALLLLYAIGGAFLAGAIILSLHIWKSGVYAPAVSSTASPMAVFRHPLTGAKIDAPITAPWVYALMIDNSADAWPQRGVDQALLVIETLAEGRIPRLLAFYSSDQTVDMIGPVRSARPYFIDWASGLEALYGHVGGSPDALEQLPARQSWSGGKSSNVFDLNQFFNGEFYWRSTHRYAPHNVYTSTDLLAKALKQFVKQNETPSYTFWIFKDDGTVMTQENTDDVHADFGSPDYLVTWKYDATTNTYVRYQGGVQMIMEDGAQITANNVIVMKTDMEVIDWVGRREIRTVGTGLAELYQDGTAVAVTWKKERSDAPLKFFVEDGSEASMNIGKTWIEVVE